MMRTPISSTKKKHNSLLIYISIIVAVFVTVVIVFGVYLYLEKEKAALAIPDVSPFSKQQVITPKNEPIKQQVNSAQITEDPSRKDDAIVTDDKITAESEVLPPLDESDTIVLLSAQQLSSLPIYASILNKEDLLRNLVVFTENLARGDLLQKFSPLTKPSAKFSILKLENELYLDPRSYHRYNTYVDIINSIDIDIAVQQYHRFTPLFDEVYDELGYPENVFDDSLMKIINSVLATPIITQPIKLVAPSVMYKYADPKLEELPAIQKLLLRMGPDNTLKLKAKMQKLKQALSLVIDNQ